MCLLYSFNSTNFFRLSSNIVASFLLKSKKKEQTLTFPCIAVSSKMTLWYQSLSNRTDGCYESVTQVIFKIMKTP